MANTSSKTPQAPAPGDVPADAPSNPFDLSALRLPQDFGAQLGVKKVITTVPVRKPDKQTFIRVRAGEEWRLQTMVLELKEEREIYLVAPPLWEALFDECKPVCLFVAMTRQKVLFLWPAKLPSSEGRADSWSESALKAVEVATEKWVRVAPNMGLGGYDLHVATGQGLSEPEWPDLDLQGIIKLAFQGRLIDSLEHPIIRRLQGAA